MVIKLKGFWSKKKINKIKRAETPTIAYICDRKKCGKKCSKWCSHTSDIKHAKNFNDKGGGFYEEVEKW